MSSHEASIILQDFFILHFPMKKLATLKDLRFFHFSLSVAISGAFLLSTLHPRLLMGHLSMIRSSGTKKKLFHLFTAHIVPFLGAHNGYAIFGECREVKTEIDEYKNVVKSEK